MRTPDQLVIDRVLTDAHEELGQGLVGALVGGSVASRTTTIESDIDIWLVIRQPWRQRMRIFVYSREVDIFVEPYPRMIEEFQNGLRDFCVTMFASGKILYDSDGSMQQLVDTARDLWSGPKPPPSEAKLSTLKYHAVTLFRDAKVALTDPEQASLLLTAAVSIMLEYHYAFSRRWTVSQKKILKDLEAHSPIAAVKARHALRSDVTMADRIIAGRELMLAVMGPGVEQEVDQPVATPRLSIDNVIPRP